MALEIIEARAQSEGRDLKILDIGAGPGTFIKGVSPSLIDPGNVMCIEYSDHNCCKIIADGFNCSTHDIQATEFDRYENTFDVVCLFHVLEHLQGLDEIFERLTRLSTDHADLFFAVPNAKQRELYDHAGVVEDNPPTHIGRWRKRSFITIAERHNWELVQHSIEPQPLISKLRRFLSIYLGKTDVSRRLDRIRSRQMRRLAKAMLIPACATLTIPTLIKLLKKDTGVSQFVHLRKVSASKE